MTLSKFRYCVSLRVHLCVRLRWPRKVIEWTRSREVEKGVKMKNGIKMNIKSDFSLSRERC